MAPRKLLTIEELCRDWLNVSPQWFARGDNRKSLKAEGFPDPVPGMGRRWDPAAIKAWLDAKSGLDLDGGATPTLTTTITLDPIADAQRTLQQRLSRMGVTS